MTVASFGPPPPFATLMMSARIGPIGELLVADVDQRDARSRPAGWSSAGGPVGRATIQRQRGRPGLVEHATAPSIQDSARDALARPPDLIVASMIDVEQSDLNRLLRVDHTEHLPRVVTFGTPAGRSTGPLRKAWPSYLLFELDEGSGTMQRLTNMTGSHRILAARVDALNTLDSMLFGGLTFSHSEFDCPMQEAQ